jgi:23S rRNA (uracil1939-C5)-methyltransferase
MAKKNTDKWCSPDKSHRCRCKGVSVAKAPDGKVVFILNVVPGDVVDANLRSARPIREKHSFS